MSLEPNKIPLADPVLDDDKIHISRTWYNYFMAWANQIIAGVVQSVTGTAGRILVSGTATNPVINIDPAYVGQNSITTLGNVATGTWNATPIAATKGGTGLTSYTIGDTLYADSPATLAKLAGTTSARRYYLGQFGTGSASAAPEWRPMPLWNVLDYGAQAGGVFDNKTAFDACVTAAYAAKSGIFIPEGIFYLSSWWLNALSNGLIIQTAGPGTQLKFGDGVTDAYGTYCMRISGGCRKITTYGGTFNFPADVAQDCLQLGIGGAGASQAYECEWYSSVFTGNSGSTLQRGIVAEQTYIHQFYGCKVLSFGIPIVFGPEANSITSYGCSIRSNQSKRMILSATGYVPAVLTDIGKTIVQAVTGATAILLSYDNNKRWWELGSTTGSFSDTDIVTITSGTGAGTVVDALYYINRRLIDAQSGQQNTFFGGDIENCGSWLSNTGCEGLSFVGVYFEASADVAIHLEAGFTHFDKCFLSEGRAYIYEGGKCSFTHNRIRKTGTSYFIYFIYYAKLTFDAAGYTFFNNDDIGLPITGGSGSAKIVAFDNTTRVVTCIPTANFTNGTVCITTGGTGAGTLAAAGGYTQDTPMDIPMFTAESNWMEYTTPGSTTTGLFTRGFTTGLQSWKWDASGPVTATLSNFCSINQERIFDANTATLKTLIITNADGFRVNGPVDANVGDSRFKTISLTQTTGTAPMSVSSTTKVTNLNVDLLDGLDSTDFAGRSGFSSSFSATAGNWYRIASNGTVAVGGTGGNRASALFTLKDATGGRNMEFSFYASVNFGSSPTITLVNQSTFTARLFDKIRIVYANSVGSVEGAAVEVQVNGSMTAAARFSIYDNDAATGWVAEDFTAGSIPGGTYTSLELNIANGEVVAISADAAGNVYSISRAGLISCTGISSSDDIALSAAGKGITYQAGPKDLAGSADPEASVTAPAGSTYRRTNGTLYVKASGAGNTGWIAIIAAVSSSTFSATLTGCTTSPSGTARYTVSGNVVTLTLPSLSGTSNATTLTYTGLPAAIQPTSIQYFTVPSIQDNSAFVTLKTDVSVTSSGTITFQIGDSPTGFTNSGTKGIGHVFTITYQLQ